MKRGVALLWVLILSMVLLTISGTMASYIIKESQSTLRIEESTKAYAAAKSGVEWAGKYIADNPTNFMVTNKEIIIEPNLVTALVTIDATKKVFSTGKSGQATRKIEHQITSATNSSIGLPTSGSVASTVYVIPELSSNTGSFTFGFDAWFSSSSASVGLRDQDDNYKHIYAYWSASTGRITLRAKTGLAATLLQSEPSTNTYLTTSSTKSVRAEISYVRNNGITLTLRENFPESKCLEVLTIPLNGNEDFGNLNKLYAPSFTYDGDYGSPSSSISNSSSHAVFFYKKD